MIKGWKKLIATAVMLAALIAPTFSKANSVQQADAAASFTTTATGYTKASDVKYVTSGNYIANWGARGEDCTFLSTYAQSFYTGSYVYQTVSQKSGGSSQSNASGSALYKELQTLMTSKHSKQTSYGATRDMYKYTDCVSGNYSKISSFYSGKVLSGTWDGGSTWNREHTWPNSKGLAGNDENDIMMLRPTSVSENSSRGNTAYGQSSGYYDPNGEGTEVRGDCARIFLYVYVRWGNTQYAWGKSGVMESMNVLLQWMEEDPVDTWEMGRNDAVQKITGTRNVFVDYPEYAWLLFGKSIPQNMSTPSGIADNQQGGSGDSSSSSSESSSSSNSSSSIKDSSSWNDSSYEENSTAEECSEHKYGNWYVINQPTATEFGEMQRFCIQCGNAQSSPMSKQENADAENDGEHSYGKWVVVTPPTATKYGKKTRVCEDCGKKEEEVLLKYTESKDGTGEKEGCKSTVGVWSGCVLLLLGGALCYKKCKKNENE
ncbi:MAG: endonuclease [Clostridia bacterium]|nr:endonuclease [Clostridia bacterium]